MSAEFLYIWLEIFQKIKLHEKANVFVELDKTLKMAVQTQER